MGVGAQPRSAHVVTLFDGGDGGELGFIKLIVRVVAVREALEVVGFPLLFFTSPSLAALHVFSTRERFEVGWDAAHGRFDFPAYRRTQTDMREGTHMLRAWKPFRTRI